jgi:hypothetical protein
MALVENPPAHKYQEATANQPQETKHMSEDSLDKLKKNEILLQKRNIETALKKDIRLKSQQLKGIKSEPRISFDSFAVNQQRAENNRLFEQFQTLTKINHHLLKKFNSRIRTRNTKNLFE